MTDCAVLAGHVWDFSFLMFQSRLEGEELTTLAAEILAEAHNDHNLSFCLFNYPARPD